MTVFAAHLPYKPTEKADQIYYKYMMQCVYDGWVVGNACTCFFMYVYIYIYGVRGIAILHLETSFSCVPRVMIPH